MYFMLSNRMVVMGLAIVSGYFVQRPYKSEDFSESPDGTLLKIIQTLTILEVKSVTIVRLR